MLSPKLRQIANCLRDNPIIITMQNRLILVAFLVANCGHISSAKSILLPEGFNVTSTSTVCGELLNSPKGGIVYKPFDFQDEFENNERCVWIISVPEAVEYEVEIIYLGFTPSSSQNGLVVSGVKLRNGDRFVQWAPQGVGTHLFTDSSPYSTTNSLVVTFYSGPNARNDDNSSGFILKYTATAFGHSNNIRTESSRDVLIKPEMEDVRHPSSKNEKYGWHDLSTFVFLPENNILSDGTKLTVLYTRLGLAGYDGYRCNDALQVYFLNSEAPDQNEKWEYQGPLKICSDDEIRRLQHNDLILLSFYSDMSQGADGFHLINFSTRDNNHC